MADVVKSIFRQKEYEKIWVLRAVNCHYYTEHKIEYERNVLLDEPLSDLIVGEYDIEIPLLEVGDKFFLCDIEKEVKIESRMRSSDGSITYYVEDKLVETENTKLSKEKCEKELEDMDYYKNNFFGLEKAFNELKEKFDDYKKEYKYKNKFFNFGSGKAPNDKNR